MTSTKSCRAKIGFGVCAVVACLFMSRMAAAEVTVLKSDTWEFFTAGRVNAFFNYGRGDGNPLKLVTDENIPMGGGLNPNQDSDPGPLGPDNMTQLQGTFKTMRVRSGFVPNSLAFGLRKQVSANNTMTILVNFWAPIETLNQRKTDTADARMQEGYVKVEGPWGSFLAGRAGNLFSRGATENDFLYGHGYSLGFPGNIDNIGPTAGMIGFGVLATFFSPGFVYVTPKVAGLQLNVGIYDPSVLAGGFDKSGLARPEAELTYDLHLGLIKLHLFGNGETEDVYLAGSTTQERSTGVGYGGRMEIGPIRVAGAGHYGKGLGLAYALQGGPINVSQNFHLRTFDGYSVFGQFAQPRFEINLGWGISRVKRLEEDYAGNVSLPEQAAYSAAFVFHATENYHLSIDVMHVDARWTGGEKQVMNFVSTGAIATW